MFFPLLCNPPVEGHVVKSLAAVHFFYSSSPVIATPCGDGPVSAAAINSGKKMLGLCVLEISCSPGIREKYQRCYGVQCMATHPILPPRYNNHST